jgi:conjugal transfer pilus assembly protein TraW
VSRAIAVLNAIALGLAAAPCAARDYGQAGTLFPIVEADLLEAIRTRLLHLQATGATARLNEELKRRTTARVNRPAPVEGISHAASPRSWLFDPTITLEEAIADDKGRTIWPAGTRVNPLDSVPLRQRLLFFDGDDSAQLTWALAEAKRAPAKLILTSGAPLDLMRTRKARFYFDQGGTLTAKFAIRAVPALVEQEGRQLRISEVALAPARRAVP